LVIEKETLDVFVEVEKKVYESSHKKISDLLFQIPKSEYYFGLEILLFKVISLNYSLTVISNFLKLINKSVFLKKSNPKTP
jgi:hypothetical protein